MNDGHISISKDVLINAATGHSKAAEYLAGVPASNDAIQATFDSLGPIYAGIREEARLKLEERRQSYEAQAAEHSDTAEKLRTAESSWTQGEVEAREAFKALVDGS